MGREEWITKCAARFATRGGLPIDTARAFAESVFENIGGDTSEDPEEAADEDMSCWEHDA